MSSNRFAPLEGQFGRGIDISATRIQSVLETYAGYVNEPTDQFLERRFIQTHMVGGYQADKTPANLNGPWLRQFNGTIDVCTLETPTTFQNPFRLKDNFNSNLYPETDPGSSYCTWEMSWTTTNPVLIQSINVWLATDTDYANDFQKIAGGWVDDMVVQLTVDSDQYTEDRQKNAVELIVSKQSLQAFQFAAPPGVVDNMLPPHPTGAAKGVCLEIPTLAALPAQARIRLSISVPDYAFPIAHWTICPWATEVWSMGVTLLEPLT